MAHWYLLWTKLVNLPILGKFAIFMSAKNIGKPLSFQYLQGERGRLKKDVSIRSVIQALIWLLIINERVFKYSKELGTMQI